MGHGELGQTLKMMFRFFCFLFFSIQLIAGPPTLSNDPFIPDVGQFEINLGAHIEQGRERVIAAPIIDANYGVFKNVQITGVLAYATDGDQRGFDAFEFSVKWKFYDDNFFAIALNPVYFSYPVSTVFNEGEVYKLSVPMSFVFSENWSWLIDLSYIYPREERDHFELGTYLQYTQGTQNVYLEYFAEESKYHDAIFSLLNVGYLWQFHDYVAWMVSVGREIRAEEKEATIAYSALQFTF